MADTSAEYLDNWEPRPTTKEITPIPGWTPPEEIEREEHFRLAAIAALPPIAKKWWVLPLAIVGVIAIVLLMRRK